MGRNNITSEIDEVEKLNFENKTILKLIKMKYNNTKFPDNFGLTENCLIIRKHNEEEVIYLMNKWWM